eukprot:GILI01021116.1.p1 GENE.GILI01021116.1~~GILI01021116.1.p1  ORF type:complete len:645 (-),score=68.33 GILI01021116.1:54-1988(-)
MFRRPIMQKMRLSTALTVNMPMLAGNLRKIEEIVTAGASSIRTSAADRNSNKNGRKTLVLPMVKGNAYGCGIVPISRFLSTELGYKTLGVATLHEAIYTMEALPELASDHSQNFVVFSDTEIQHPEWQTYYSQRPLSTAATPTTNKPTPTATTSTYIGCGLESRRNKDIKLNARIIPVIGTKTDLSYYLDSIEGDGAKSPFYHTPLFVKVNTGMNRMGLLPEELISLSPRIRRLRPANDNNKPRSTSPTSPSLPDIHIQKGGIDMLLQHFSTSWFPVGSDPRDVAFLNWTRESGHLKAPSSKQHTTIDSPSLKIATSTTTKVNEGNLPATHAHILSTATSNQGKSSVTNQSIAVEDRTGTHTTTDDMFTDLMPPVPVNTTLQQYHTFKTLELYLDKCCGVPVHDTSVANSGAIEQSIGVTESVVRPGLMMYGPPSVTTPTKLWNGSTIGRLETKIVKVFIVGDDGRTLSGEDDNTNSGIQAENNKTKQEDVSFLASLPSFPYPNSNSLCVGYGFNSTRGGPAVVAILALGYADGFLRYNAGLPISINGLRGEVHGFVNMDLTQVVFYPIEMGKTVDEVVSKLNETVNGTAAGSPNVTIWSHDNSDIDNTATFLKTNAYQLLTALSVRVPRVYEYGEYAAPDVNL